MEIKFNAFTEFELLPEQTEAILLTFTDAQIMLIQNERAKHAVKLTNLVFNRERPDDVVIRDHANTKGTLDAYTWLIESINTVKEAKDKAIAEEAERKEAEQRKLAE